VLPCNARTSGIENTRHISLLSAAISKQSHDLNLADIYPENNTYRKREEFFEKITTESTLFFRSA
jgi:chemotaxis methyl-accepting protein methylase